MSSWRQTSERGDCCRRRPVEVKVVRENTCQWMHSDRPLEHLFKLLTPQSILEHSKGRGPFRRAALPAPSINRRTSTPSLSLLLSSFFPHSRLFCQMSTVCAGHRALHVSRRHQFRALGEIRAVLKLGQAINGGSASAQEPTSGSRLPFRFDALHSALERQSLFCLACFFSLLFGGRPMFRVRCTTFLFGQIPRLPSFQNTPQNAPKRQTGETAKAIFCSPF